MTPFNVCAACVRLNLPDASICSTCAAPLLGAAPQPSAIFVDLTEMELDADTTPSVHLDAPELQRWFSSRTGGLDAPAEPAHVAPTREPDAPPPPPLPPLPPLTLREVEAMSAPDDDGATPADPLPPGVVVSDPDAQPPQALVKRLAAGAAAAAPPQARRGSTPAPPADTAADATVSTKVQRRAQVRRKVLANKGHPVATATLADVLVLESDDAARVQLCALLEAFGFRTHPVQSTMQAVRMLAAKRYAVAFLSVIFDGSAGPASHDLCSRVKAPPVHAHDTVCALIVVTGSARPLERVRAELAGCDAFLPKPASRGAVAQALEACGVALPIDARRA